MKAYETGDVIEIPCSIEPGAFIGEYFVTIRLDGEDVSGFVPRGLVSVIGESEAYISGTIERVLGSTITVRIPGSYFTTTGIADISQQWAQNNVRIA